MRKISRRLVYKFLLHIEPTSFSFVHILSYGQCCQMFALKRGANIYAQRKLDSYISKLLLFYGQSLSLKFSCRRSFKCWILVKNSNSFLLLIATFTFSLYFMNVVVVVVVVVVKVIKYKNYIYRFSYLLAKWLRL